MKFAMLIVNLRAGRFTALIGHYYYTNGTLQTHDQKDKIKC